jgi:hypothetical protein
LKLQTTETFALYGCHSLKIVRLPASIRNFDGAGFAACSVQRVEIEIGNQYFHATSDFILDLADCHLIRYFGSNSCLLTGLIPAVSSFDSFAFLSCNRI